jgi:hypothetical protein
MSNTLLGGIGAVRTAYFSMKRKGEKRVNRTVAIGSKIIKFRFFLKDGSIRETKTKLTEEIIDYLKKQYSLKPISYFQFLTINK